MPTTTNWSANNALQRAGHDQVHRRGQSLTVFVQVLLARVLTGQRTVAKRGRWAPFRARLDCGTIALNRR
jgi:hypothetical protein